MTRENKFFILMPYFDKFLTKIPLFQTNLFVIPIVVIMALIICSAAQAAKKFEGYHPDRVDRSKIEREVSLFYSGKYQEAAMGLLAKAERPFGNGLANFLSMIIYTVPSSPLSSGPGAMEKATYFISNAGGCGGAHRDWLEDMPRDLKQGDAYSVGVFGRWFNEGVYFAKEVNCVNFYPSLLRAWQMSDFDREANISSFIALVVPLAAEHLAAKGIHLDGYVAQFYLRMYPSQNYDSLYELMRQAEDGPPLPGDGPDIWFGACDDHEKAAGLRNITKAKHYLQKVVIRYFWENACEERRRVKSPNFREGLVRFRLREPENSFAPCVLSQIDPSYWEKRSDCAEMFPPDWPLVNFHANKAVKNGDFNAHASLSEIEIGWTALHMLAEGSYSSEYEQDQVLAWIQENASEYFWEIADFCDAEVSDAEATELLECYRESHANDIKCLSYTDYFVAGVGKIRMSEFYGQCRFYLMNH